MSPLLRGLCGGFNSIKDEFANHSKGEKDLWYSQDAKSYVSYSWRRIATINSVWSYYSDPRNISY